MRGDVHVRFGGRAEETDRGKPRHRASVRPITHFTKAGRAAIAVMDLVSRKWIGLHCSVEETSTQVEIVFIDALETEGLTDEALVRAEGLVGIDEDDERRPILLAISDNGPQMTSGSTREFMGLHAIAQHFGRLHTPTDQAHIETLSGHIKTEYPHLEEIDDPVVLWAELERVRGPLQHRAAA